MQQDGQNRLLKARSSPVGEKPAPKGVQFGPRSTGDAVRGPKGPRTGGAQELRDGQK